MKNTTILLASLFTFLVGCSLLPKPNPTVYQAPSLSGITDSVQTARQSVQNAQQSTSKASGYIQQSSLDSAKYAALLQQNTNAWYYYTESQNDLTNAQTQLSNSEAENTDALAALDAATNKIATQQTIISQQTDALNTETSIANTAITKDAKDVKRGDWWESKALWTWGILLAIAVIFVAIKYGPQIAKFAATLIGTAAKAP